jgi:hypothetical protein
MEFKHLKKFENFDYNTKPEVNEGLFTTSWKGVEKDMNKQSDWESKKNILLNAVKEALPKKSGAWENRIKSIKTEEEFNKLVDEIRNKKGSDLEDKLRVTNFKGSNVWF